MVDIPAECYASADRTVLYDDVEVFIRQGHGREVAHAGRWLSLDDTLRANRDFPFPTKAGNP